jgi:hypothetical protein
MDYSLTHRQHKLRSMRALINASPSTTNASLQSKNHVQIIFPQERLPSVLRLCQITINEGINKRVAINDQRFITKQKSRSNHFSAGKTSFGPSLCAFYPSMPIFVQVENKPSNRDINTSTTTCVLLKKCRLIRYFDYVM